MYKQKHFENSHFAQKKKNAQTHHKAKTILQVDLTDATIALEKLLHISLSGVRTQAPNEDTAATHDDFISWDERVIS